MKQSVDKPKKGFSFNGFALLSDSTLQELSQQLKMPFDETKVPHPYS